MYVIIATAQHFIQIIYIVKEINNNNRGEVEYSKGWILLKRNAKITRIALRINSIKRSILIYLKYNQIKVIIKK